MDKDIRAFLDKGSKHYYGQRFKLYAIPEAEWRSNKYFESVAATAEYKGVATPADTNVYVLYDATQVYNGQWFTKFPYSNTFKQMYTCDVRHLGGGEDMFSLGERSELDFGDSHYDYYTAAGFIVRGNKICYCGTNISGSFSVGENLEMTDDEISEFLSTSSCDYEMLRENRRVSRAAKNPKTGDIYVYSYDDIYDNAVVYVINERANICGEYEVKMHTACFDGGTTNVIYTDGDSEHTLKYDTPFNDPMIDTLDSEITLDDMEVKSKSEIIANIIYGITGTRMVH